MVGSALVRLLSRENCEVLTVPRSEVDLRDQAATRRWLVDTQPDAVIMAAARVGGIAANSASPVSFLYDNLMIEANVIEVRRAPGWRSFFFSARPASIRVDAQQPIREESLLTGPLEKTNEWYAIAKIAGIKLCQAYRQEQGLDFISAQPTNLYGPGDNYDLETSHVLPALIRKAHEAN